MATIGGYTVIGWRGRLYPAQRRMARLPPRPGVTGEAWVYDQWQTNPDEIVTRAEFSSLALAQAAETNYRKLMDGATKTAVDPLGVSWSVKVVGVVCEVSATTVANVFALVARWQLQVEAVPPV